MYIQTESGGIPGQDAKMKAGNLELRGKCVTHFVLLYDYVEEVLEKRQPYRDEHLGLLTTLHAEGRLAMAGAWNDPVDGAALVFVGDDDSVVRDFVQRDPYVVNGLVTGWRIREWNVVVGGETEG